jgi:hypothetical protein
MTAAPDFMMKQMQNTSGGNWLHDNLLQKDSPDTKKTNEGDKKRKRLAQESLVTNNWNPGL